MDKTYAVVRTSSLIGSNENLDWILESALKKGHVAGVKPLYNSLKNDFSREVFHKLVDG
jgi:hypothetical protein